MCADDEIERGQVTDTEKLQRALELVAEVMQNLTTESSGCALCGHKRYENWDHAQLHEILTAVLNRLVKVIRRLRRPADLINTSA